MPRSIKTVFASKSETIRTSSSSCGGVKREHARNFCLFILDCSVDIGFVTRTTLNGLVESGDVSPQEEKKFYTGAKAFFLRAFQYGEDVCQ